MANRNSSCVQEERRLRTYDKTMTSAVYLYGISAFIFLKENGHKAWAMS
jgi:hypothetical protein